MEKVSKKKEKKEEKEREISNDEKVEHEKRGMRAEKNREETKVKSS